MTSTAHEYTGLEDFEALLQLTSMIAARREPGCAIWHPGDCIWQLHLSGLELREASERIRLWRQDGSPVACAVAFADGMHIDVLPGHPEEQQLFEQVLGWAEARLARTGGRLTIASLASDSVRRKRLEAFGYSQGPANSVRMRRSLGGPIEQPVLPPGMRFRDCANVDLEQRAAAHRDAWEHLDHIGIHGARSSISVESYVRLRETPGYDPRLDFAIEDADGTIVACCNCWADPASGIGMFEPVGTREAYRRRGLARALVLGALERLHERGLQTALIATTDINTPAIGAYQGCGLEIVDHTLTYTKQIAGV